MKIDNIKILLKKFIKYLEEKESKSCRRCGACHHVCVMLKEKKSVAREE